MGRTRKNEKVCGRKHLCPSTSRKNRRLAMINRKKRTELNRESSSSQNCTVNSTISTNSINDILCYDQDKTETEAIESVDGNTNIGLVNPQISESSSLTIPNSDIKDVNKSSEKKNIENKDFVLDGKRLFDVNHLFRQILNGERHEPFDCCITDMKIISEKRSGLYCEYTLKCQMCSIQKIITNEEKMESKLDMNTSLVLGSISIGIGYSQMNELAASLNMPLMSPNTFSDYHMKVAHLIRESAWKSMEEAATEEANYAIAEGEVDEDGIPCITVVTDGAWGKRSYNVNYDASSGVACIVGYRTGKILFLGLRNKYCSLCSWYQSRDKDIPVHQCFKNWSGTSTSMETDIIAEGFRKSVELYNIKYTKMVGDGDSSVYRKLLQTKPYGNLLVQKVECKNHLLRNFAKKLREICGKPRSTSKNLPVALALRKEILKRFMRLRTAITKATRYRINEETTMERKIELLRGDIYNAPSHVYGEHEKCKELKYFKCERENENNLVPNMQECGVHQDIMIALQRVIDNSSSLILNMDNNLAEHYNNVVCKFVGGKRINFSKRGSYQTRCEAAALSFNSCGNYYRVICKTASGASPQGFTKKYVVRSRKRILHCKKRLFPRKKAKTKNVSLPDKDYGPDAHYIPLDLTSDIYRKKEKDFLQKLKKSPEEIENIEKSTIGQASNSKWQQERALRITASNFGKICKMRSKTSPTNAVKTLIYGGFSGNKATKYGNESELRAILDFESQVEVKVSQCGLFIDPDNFYLAASPDGCVGDQALIEIKCPFVIAKMTPKDGIEQGKINFAILVNDTLQLKRNHNYFYQVQGQLAITKRQYCYFIIWSPFGMLIEKINRDEDFWQKEMLPKLKTFYDNFMLPELVDPLLPKTLPIRDKICEGKISNI